jgi:hypothetical protein
MLLIGGAEDPLLGVTKSSGKATSASVDQWIFSDTAGKTNRDNFYTE